MQLAAATAAAADNDAGAEHLDIAAAQKRASQLVGSTERAAAKSTRVQWSAHLLPTLRAALSAIVGVLIHQKSDAAASSGHADTPVVSVRADAPAVSGRTDETAVSGHTDAPAVSGCTDAPAVSGLLLEITRFRR